MEGTFARYLEATHYEVKQGILYQLRNWLVQASKYATWGDARIIQNPDPKLVAWLMSTDRRGRNKSAGAMKSFGQFTTGHRWISGKVRKDGTRGRSYWKQTNSKDQQRARKRVGFYTREQAKKFSIKHFSMRMRASNFIGAFIWRMTGAIKGAMGSPAVANNRRLGNAIGVQALQYGEKGQSGVSVQAMYGYKHATTAAKTVSTEESANRLERWIIKALEDAKETIIPNMEQKIAQKLQQAADRSKRGGR
jgi:hypothetical protein